jgi:hypothetical protein
MESRTDQLQCASEHEKLADVVRSTVGSFLGTGFTSHVSPSKAELHPIAARILAAGLFALIPILQLLCTPSSHVLILLSSWGVIYFGLVVALTRSTSIAIIEIVNVLLLPNVSEEFAGSARKNIEKNFAKKQIFRKSVCASSVAMLISCVLLRQFHWFPLSIWGVGFFILYFTASQATLTAPFYTCFSYSLKQHSDVLFPVDPAASPAVSACTALAKRLFSYWFAVFMLVMSLTGVLYIMAYPLASKFVGTSSAGVARFISIVVFVAGFFSFGLGSLVYLRFESDLRIAVERVRLATLSRVQARYRDLLFSNQGALSAEECSQLGHLKGTSDSLSRPGYLRSSLQSIAVVVVAILPPLVSIVVAVLTYRKAH